MLVSPFDSGVSSDIEDGDELDDEDDCNIVFAAEEEISKYSQMLRWMGFQAFLSYEKEISSENGS